jgi:hypothetical protein
VVLFLTVFNGGGDKKNTSSPKDTVSSFLNAAKDSDVGAARKLVCTEDLKSFDSNSKEALGVGDNEKLASYTVESTKQNGNVATVSVALRGTKGNKVSSKITVKQESGKWLVCPSAQ